jgi:hypothetical protein
VRAPVLTEQCDNADRLLIERDGVDALPLQRHDWHGDWNYTLRPEAYPRIPITAPDPFDQPSPDLAWLHHPAITGLPTQQWDTLITTLTALHDQQRETQLDTRRGRGHRPRQTAAGSGRRPVLTLPDRLMAAVLHHRLALPQVTIAVLFASDPRPSTNASAISEACWIEQDKPSNPPNPPSPA